MEIKRLFAIGLVLLGLVATTYGASAARQRATGATAVKTKNVKGLGVVLVNAKGRTLYTFAKDQRRHVTCTGQCAAFWPPLKWSGAGKPTGSGAVKSKFLGVDMSPSGAQVVTYDKWPLYTFVEDKAAGQANGQDLNESGGKWYVITPAGKLIKHKPS
jgi:predicted lipoprotein with Yx(FWY)xxD motif